LRVNDIIRAYRIVTKETFNNGNISRISRDQFLKLVFYGEVDGNGVLSRARWIQHIERLEVGYVSGETYAEISRLAGSAELALECPNDEILLQAQSFLQQENYRMTVLEAVIALEIAVSSTIRKKSKEEGISEDDIENFLIDVELSQCLKVVLRLLISEGLPSKDVLSGCKGAIRIRNDVVHRARSSVTQKEAQDAVSNIQMFIEHVKSSLE
jgi:hypothetical protein